MITEKNGVQLISRCNRCPASIVWLKTAAGKNMCVQPTKEAVRRKEYGEPYQYGAVGLEPHWAYCAGAKDKPAKAAEPERQKRLF
jgi:hypothetical protein